MHGEGPCCGGSRGLGCSDSPLLVCPESGSRELGYRPVSLYRPDPQRCCLLPSQFEDRMPLSSPMGRISLLKPKQVPSFILGFGIVYSTADLPSGDLPWVS